MLPPDGNQVLAVAEGGALLWWDTDRCTPEVTPGPDQQLVTASAISPDGGCAAVGLGDGRLCCWRRQDRAGWLDVDTQGGVSGAVTALALSADGRHALSGTTDGQLCWWDLGTPDLRQRWEGHLGRVESVALSPDGRHALTGGDDGRLCWWALGGRTASPEWEARSGQVIAMALPSEGRRALTGGRDRSLRWWDLPAGRCLAEYTSGFPVTAVALAKQRGYTAAAGDNRGRVYFFDILE
jgi:WD40 repeat protein